MSKFYIIKKDDSLFLAYSWDECDRIIKDCHRATYTVYKNRDEVYDFLREEYRKRGKEMPSDPLNEGFPALW